MKIDSIIFDLDGTLWDSTEGVLKSWNDVLGSYDEIKEPLTIEMLQGVFGLQLYQIGEKLFPFVEDSKRVEIIERCCEEENKYLLQVGGMLYPDLESVLQKLYQSHSLFIVSNCQCGYIETFLEYHQLERYFKDIECAGNTSLVKGENIKMIVERNNLLNPVYVGDTQGDCDAAKLAGVPFIFASYGFGKVDSYDYKLETISDIINL